MSDAWRESVDQQLERLHKDVRQLVGFILMLVGSLFVFVIFAVS